MIQQDAERISKLRQQIKALEQHMAHVAESSTIASRLATIPGFDKVCTAELASEIGMIERSRKEASLALYLGMATLDHSSGKSRGSMWPNHVNLRAKATMMIANGEFQTNVDLIKGKVSMSKVSDRSFLLERSVSASQRSEGPLSVACDGVEDIICWLRGLVGCP